MGTELKNPPIVEAACEFKFSDAFEDLTIYGILHEKLGKKFLKKKTRKNLEIVLERTNGKMEPRSIERDTQLYLNEDEKSIIQVGPQALVISKIKPYGKWENFLTDIENVYRLFLDVTELKELTRIGLRYINKINFHEPKIDLEKYYSFKPNVDNKLGDTLNSFIVGAQIPKSDGRDLLKITLTSAVPDEGFKVAHLLDIDYATSDLSDINLDNSLMWVKRAHDEIEKVFFACITTRLQEQLNK